MAKYVDGFVIPIKKSKVAAYKALSKKSGKVWMEYGALEYFECISDNINVKFGLPFPKLTKLKKGEVVAFAWIVYKSKAHRNKVMDLVMKDPRTNPSTMPEMPFDMDRITYGGFSVVVEYSSKSKKKK